MHNFKKKTVTLIIVLILGTSLFAQDKPRYMLVAVHDLSGEGITQLASPQGLSVSLMGDIYIADTGHNRIIKLDVQGKYVNHVGGFGWKNNQFDAPVDVYGSDGLNIYVADLNNQRIQRYSKKLEFVSSFGGSKLMELSAEKSGASTEPLGNPSSVAVSSQGDLFYSDRENGRIVKLDRFGKRESVFGGFSDGRGKLRSPGKLCVTSQFVYVVDLDRVVTYDYYGNYIRDIGADKLKKPTDVVVDQKGRVYISDSEKHTVLVFDATGALIAAVLSYPLEQPMAVDILRDQLYVLDAGTRSVTVLQILESGE